MCARFSSSTIRSTSTRISTTPTSSRLPPCRRSACSPMPACPLGGRRGCPTAWTAVAKGLEIIQALRGWTSGLAVPHFVIDAPGGGGKIPLLPEYVVKLTDQEVVLRNYAGKLYRYKQGKDSAKPLEPILVG